MIENIFQNINLSKKPLSFCWPNSYVPTASKLEKQFYFSNDLIFKKIWSSNILND